MAHTAETWSVWHEQVVCTIYANFSWSLCYCKIVSRLLGEETEVEFIIRAVHLILNPTNHRRATLELQNLGFILSQLRSQIYDLLLSSLHLWPISSLAYLIHIHCRLHMLGLLTEVKSVQRLLVVLNIRSYRAYDGCL